MAPRTKSVNTHSTSFRHRHLPATTFPSPKGNQTHLDNSNRPTTTATPPRTRSNPYHPSPTPPTPPPTPSKATSDPRRRLAGRFPAFPRGPRERERGKNERQRTANRQPPDPTRPDPIQPIGGFPPPRPAPPLSTASRHHHVPTSPAWHAADDPGARPAPVRASGSRLDWARRTGVMHRAGLGRLRGGEGEPRQRDYTARKMEPDTYTSHPLGLLSKLGCRCSLHRPVTRPTHHPNPSIDRR